MATELTVQSERAFQKQPHSKFGPLERIADRLHPTATVDDDNEKEAELTITSLP